MEEIRMNVAFRTDSSLQIGYGHLMRCLTLADELRQHGADIVFVCREHPGNMIGLIEAKGYSVVRLTQTEAEYVEAPEDLAHAAWLGVAWQQDASDTITAVRDVHPQWLIIDHYALDRRWEQMLRPYVGKIMAIDDVADRPHDCDLLLDQNLYEGMETRYDNLVPKSCHKLLGPKYALLRPEFAAARKNLRERDGQVKRVLVSFGGVDPTNETEKALQALTGNDLQFDVDVVVGGGNLHKEQIQKICAANDRFHYHCQVDNMAELMAAADLAIGAGGATTWERCFLGLPSIVLVLADNQKQAAEYLATLDILILLGDARKISPKDIADAIGIFAEKQQLLFQLSHNSSVLFDGKLDVSSLLLKGNEYA
jgi:UDP-2,4-diacetamido-2,4,6-trideoxy-beta-L-altropyranose hydrolase